MPSSHHSGNRKMKGEREEIRKCRRESNKKKSGSRDHKYCFKSAETGAERNNSSYCDARFQKICQHKERSSRTRISNNEFSTDNSSSPPTIRSPWASPQKLRPRSLWFRSPVRLDRPEYHKSADGPSSPKIEENNKSESSTKHMDHYDNDNESGYVYEKIEGWDTDTDDEETPQQKC
ncbi:hypothetical protein CAEBREN_22288 [Caenorhabditis brenneri]|uniref:Uncharacterized protein n=1 Tax=Caenorhabditis brenneri TaxID=135651 RepID=G0PH68_CAEBE|nr:hypothetical protein CAEBREN_22288 [Caenorhabditis brenneri]